MVQPTVYLEDLDGPPVPSGKCSKVKKAKSSRNGEILAVRVDLASGVPSDGTSRLPVKTLVMSTSVMHPNSAPASSAIQPGTFCPVFHCVNMLSHCPFRFILNSFSLR